jgi:hypothetical protein
LINLFVVTAEVEKLVAEKHSLEEELIQCKVCNKTHGLFKGKVHW